MNQSFREVNVKKMPCSIFNDVIGPVMRGPSSSHVAGAARIASLIRQSLNDRVVRAVVDFDINGSLAASHDGHGSDMGFACGLMGWSFETRWWTRMMRWRRRENEIDRSY